MTRHDAFETSITSWLESEAQAPVDPAVLDRALTATAARRPRPARLATLGSRWIAAPVDASAVGTSRTLPLAVRPSWVLMSVLLLALVLAASAIVIGSRPIERHAEAGQLAYELSGDIYLADADGAHAKRVSVPTSYLGRPGSIWAPNGRYFLYWRGDVHIADATGRVVASVPDIRSDVTWSPDSTRLQAWIGWIGATHIGIYGIDGLQEASIALPDGYAQLRETPSTWAPDGRSVLVQIAQGEKYPCRPRESTTDPDLPDGEPPPCAASEFWQLPIDGSAPSRLPDGSHLASFDLSLTPDGSRMAFSGDLPGAIRRVIYVANADGTDAVVAPTRPGGFNPVWSSDNAHIAYLAAVSDLGVSIRVVDLRSGLDQELVPGLVHDGWPPFSWSPAGDKILFPMANARGEPSLWSVNADGSDPTLLVDGATVGEWQTVPGTDVP